MYKLVDSHVHLDATAFDADRAEAMQRALEAGVKQMVIPGVNAANWPRIHALCEARPERLFAAWGWHPLYLPARANDAIDALRAWSARHTAVAIGEIGLDFHVGMPSPDVQRACFHLQLELAIERDLPVIVHARQALEEVILTLRRHPGVRGVVHSFSGSEQQARQLWQLGFHLGIGGPLTYERAQRLRRVVASMPIEFLLLESDAPDQPDADHRGQRNEPSRVSEVLNCVAALRGETASAIAIATTANARKLFRLPKPVVA